MSLPETMKAVLIEGKGGGPEVLKAGSRPVPRPGQGEILVKVAAAGVNRPDVLQRTGNYPPPPGASDIPGLEIAGEVVETGAGVTRFKAGRQALCAGDRRGLCGILRLRRARRLALSGWI
jgi:NADPH:quinone reductase-like Zn-dependent oxidoreductase